MHSGVNAAQRVFQPHQLSNSINNYCDTQSNFGINIKMNKTPSFSTGGRRKRERPRPNGSSLLTDAENEQFFQVLGSDRISLSAGIAQLFSSSDGSDTWQKCNAGVSTLIKDYSRKCYLIEMFDIFNWESLFSQILYKEFNATYYLNCPRFITFEGDQCVYGLNFADHDEADNFKSHLNKRSECEQITALRAESKTSVAFNSQKNLSYGTRLLQQPVSGGITTAGTVPHFCSSPMKSPFVGNGTNLNKKLPKNEKKNKKKPRHRKEDISNPTDFKHLIHLGWDEDGGFNKKIYEDQPMDDSVRDILRAAGKNPDNIDPDERKFVYQFLKKQNFFIEQSPTTNQSLMSNNQSNLSSNSMSHYQPPTPQHYNISKNQDQTYYYQQTSQFQIQKPQNQYYYSQYNQQIAMLQQPPARPPPILSLKQHNIESSGNNGMRILPQPPQHVSNNSVQKNQQNERPLQHNSPSVPPPIPPPKFDKLSLPVSQSHSVQNQSSGNPPPPPPPPPLQPFVSSTNSGAANGGVSSLKTQPVNLLQEIQAGKKLKRVDVPIDKKPVPTNQLTNRDNIMEQIKQGAQLKHVDEPEKKDTTSIQNLGGIAGALARALEERRKNMLNSEDSDEDENAENNDSEWEDD